MTALPDTLWLSCHVNYACRHTGACCRSGWPLPVETTVVSDIDAAILAGRVRTADGEPRWLLESAAAPEGLAGTFRLAEDACVFHVPRAGHAVAAAVGSHHCAVHAAMGHEALPASCRHFPRVCLTDDRGVRVSLSHYCPTAATMLFEHEGPVEIVSGPAAVAGLATPEGLDVRGGLPPRLTPAVLMDLEALTAWERVVVDTLAGPNAPAGTPAEALARVRAYAERLVQWTPGGTPLAALIGDVRASDATLAGFGGTMASADRGSDGGPYRLERQRRAMRVVTHACRAPWTWPATPANVDALDRVFVAPEWPAAGPIVRRYLAAKAFGAWISYQADAARGLVRWLQLSHDVLRVEAARACGEANRALDGDLLFTAVRQADLLLVHYADSLLVAQAL
ncbi:MAG TPA: hypothetical protein VMW48_14190 [Vicinamibacterales bacterium]|nr:hypothetical protein [Vicinamibacterales bacterium]